MAEFQRRNRLINYKSPTCMFHLRKDFNKTCAYCGTREGDMGGSHCFEIDHFKPQTPKWNGGDEYYNLYYCCTKCNGKQGKSDYFSDTLLDPCKEKIWGKHIYVENNYKVIPIDALGEEFISAIKLNSRFHKNMRQNIDEYNKMMRSQLKELEQLSSNTKLDDNQKNAFHYAIFNCENSLKYGMSYAMVNEYDRIEQELITKLQQFGEVVEVNEDNEILYSLKIGQKVVKCYVVFDETLVTNHTRQMQLEYLRHWSMSEEIKAILYYNFISKQCYIIKVNSYYKCQEGNGIRIKIPICVENNIDNVDLTVF